MYKPQMYKPLLYTTALVLVSAFYGCNEPNTNTNHNSPRGPNYNNESVSQEYLGDHEKKKGNKSNKHKRPELPWYKSPKGEQKPKKEKNKRKRKPCGPLLYSDISDTLYFPFEGIDTLVV